MSKADHMLSILWLLRSGRRMTAGELSEALEIHVRTVYRYIDALCSSGVPIVAHSGHNGGYSLLDRFSDAPLIFDLDEQKALMHASIFAQEAGYPFGEVLKKAVAKLKMYTNPEQEDEINRHLAGFDVIHPAPDPALESTLQQLERSVAGCRALTMEYRSGYGGTLTTRRVDPYGLVYWKGNWYIFAYCHLREEIRSFRVDRIRLIIGTDIVFERPRDFSARQFLMANLLPESADPRHQYVSVRIEGNPRAVNDLCQHWLLGHALAEYYQKGQDH